MILCHCVLVIIVGILGCRINNNGMRFRYICVEQDSSVVCYGIINLYVLITVICPVQLLIYPVPSYSIWKQISPLWFSITTLINIINRGGHLTVYIMHLNIEILHNKYNTCTWYIWCNQAWICWWCFYTLTSNNLVIIEVDPKNITFPKIKYGNHGV